MVYTILLCITYPLLQYTAMLYTITYTIHLYHAIYLYVITYSSKDRNSTTVKGNGNILVRRLNIVPFVVINEAAW